MSTADARAPGGELLAPVRLLTYHKETPIYHEGDAVEIWYEVVSGIVRTCRFHADGHRQLTGFFFEGDIFGIDPELRREAAEAVTRVTLRAWPSAEHKPGVSPRNGFQQERALRRALDTAQDAIFLFGRRTATDRVAAFLIGIEQRLDGKAVVELRMTRSDIADYLGLTLHTVSRTLSDLARRKLIRLNGPHHVQLLDPEGLRELAGEEPERPRASRPRR